MWYFLSYQMTIEVIISIVGFLITLVSLGITAGKIIEKINGVSLRLRSVEQQVDKIESDKDQMNLMLITHTQEIKFWKEVVAEVKEGVREIRNDFKEMANDIKAMAKK